MLFLYLLTISYLFQCIRQVLRSRRNFYIHIISYRIFSAELSARSHQSPLDVSSHMFENISSGPRCHFGGRYAAFHPCKIIADGTLAKSRIHPRVFRMGVKQSGCKFDWRHRLHRDTLISEDPKGVGVSDTVGWIWCPPAQSSSFSSAEGCLWERRLYRVRAVWIQTRSYGWKGPTRFCQGDIGGSKVDTRPSSRLQSYLYMITRGPPTTDVSSLSAKGYRCSLLPRRILLPRRHLKTDTLVPHDA